MKKSWFDSDEFKSMHMNMCIEAWNDQFLGLFYSKPFEEVYYLCSDIEEIEKYMSAYKEKYGVELTYRIDGAFSFISQVK